MPAAIPRQKVFSGGLAQQFHAIDRYTVSVSRILLLWTGLVLKTPLVVCFLSKLRVAAHRPFGEARRE